MISPHKSTLGEEIFREIDRNTYLNELYNNLLLNYSYSLLGITPAVSPKVDIDDALRFADLLSKSAGLDNSEKHRAWAQEIVALLTTLYPNDPKIEYCASSVLTSIGNYRGLQLLNTDYKSSSFMDALFANFDLEYLSVPYQENKFFFHSQKEIYDRLDDEVFSYSGPTSMGKSLLMRMFIKDKIEKDVKANFAILVPTKALISEITSNVIQDLKELLELKNYKVVNSAGAISLAEPHNFIFILTPERLLYLLISNPKMIINYLFVDEAHKISQGDSRSAFYYKVIDMLAERDVKPHVVFASPNIPNPEVYLKVIPDQTAHPQYSKATSFSPVSQLKYYIDTVDGTIRLYNEHTKTMQHITYFTKNAHPVTVINAITNATNPQAKQSQSIVYFNSRDKAISMAIDFARLLPPKNDPVLDALAKEIKTEIHDTYYLADIIKRGVAYHVGYLPAYIRTCIEKCFRDHKITTLFCTSTLVEGVNLPADNLFVMSYKNGKSIMKPVDFRNLIGRVGRIEYNLYGNVFVMRSDVAQSVETYRDLIEKDIPPQTISLVSDLTKNQKEQIVECLLAGDVEFKRFPSNQTSENYALMRKFGLILLRDITKNRNSTVRQSFAGILTPQKEDTIRQKFLSVQKNTKPDDDINVSVDQTENLYTAIKNGLQYPAMTANETFAHNDIVVFLEKLCAIFKWEKYESSTLGYVSKTDGSHSMLTYYAVILSQWMEGHGLRNIIDEAIDYKANHYGSTVKINGQLEIYNGTRPHKNAVIAETLSIIDHTVLFSLANYFLRFSTEYKLQHKIDNFDNDWYEYVEYGSTNPLTILLQRNGFSRETSTYIKQNQTRYVVQTPDGPKLKTSLLSCPQESVKIEVQDIQYNSPELFVDN